MIHYVLVPVFIWTFCLKLHLNFDCQTRVISIWLTFVSQCLVSTNRNDDFGVYWQHLLFDDGSPLLFFSDSLVFPLWTNLLNTNPSIYWLLPSCCTLQSMPSLFQSPTSSKCTDLKAFFASCPAHCCCFHWLSAFVSCSVPSISVQLNGSTSVSSALAGKQFTYHQFLTLSVCTSQLSLGLGFRFTCHSSAFVCSGITCHKQAGKREHTVNGTQTWKA